jgi:hypothetical protein
MSGYICCRGGNATLGSKRTVVKVTVATPGAEPGVLSVLLAFITEGLGVSPRRATSLWVEGRLFRTLQNLP